MYRRLQPMPHPECQLQRWIDLIAEKRLPADTTFKAWFDYWVSSRRVKISLDWMTPASHTGLQWAQP